MKKFLEKFQTKQVQQYTLYFDDVEIKIIDAEIFDQILELGVKAVFKGFVTPERVTSVYLEIDNHDYLLIKDGTEFKTTQKENEAEE